MKMKMKKHHYFTNIQENASTSSERDRACSLFIILLAGALSMYLAEIWSGASTTWFLDPFGIFLTYPLYLSHLLFYYNLAHRFQRTDLLSLYFWGMLFALYEAPITKVLWAGYIGQQPIAGTFLGMAIFEFITLVFFWHPIFSFILPILILELFLANQESAVIESLPPSHLSILKNSRRNQLLSLMIFLIASPFLIHNSGYDIVRSVASILGSLLIVFALQTRLKRSKKAALVNGLILGKRGLILVGTYLLLLYLVLTPFLLPERLPHSAIPYLTTLFFLGMVLLVLKMRKTTQTKTEAIQQQLTLKNSDDEQASSRHQLMLLPNYWIYLMFAMHVVLTVLFGVFPPYTSIMTSVSFLLLPIIGVSLLVYSMTKIIRRHNQP